jgi:hypothetical protein
MQTQLTPQRKILSTTMFGLASAALLSLSSCSSDPQEKSAIPNAAATETMSFAAWCESWHMSCPETPREDKNALTLSQWQAVATIAHELTLSDSEITLTRERLEQDALKKVVGILKVGDLYSDILQKVDQLSWQELQMQKGHFSLTMASESSYVGPSSLTFKAAQNVEIAIDPAAALNIAGVSIASEARGDALNLQSIAVTDASRLALNTTDISIQDVPMSFMMDELMAGIRTDSLKDLNLGIKEIISAIPHLMTWVDQPGLNIALDQQFFSVTSAQLPKLMPNEKSDSAAVVIVNAIGGVTTRLATANADLATVKQRSGSKLNCEMDAGGKKIKMKFESAFGVKRYYNVDASSVGLEFFGIKVAIPQAFGVTISLKRVELTPEKIIIRDIPLLGKYEIKLSELQSKSEDQKTTSSSFSCTK